MTALIYKGTPLAWHVVEMPETYGKAKCEFPCQEEEICMCEINEQVAIDNAVPVKEEFQEKVYQAIWKDHGVEVEDHVWRWQPTPNKLYEDTGLVFEYKNQQIPEPERDYYPDFHPDYDDDLKRWKECGGVRKVAILVSDKPKEKTMKEYIGSQQHFEDSINADIEQKEVRDREQQRQIDRQLIEQEPPVEVKEEQSSDAWKYWEEDQKTNPNPINPHAFVYGWKCCLSKIKQLESSEGQDDLWLMVGQELRKDNSSAMMNFKNLISKFHITKI